MALLRQLRALPRWPPAAPGCTSAAPGGPQIHPLFGDGGLRRGGRGGQRPGGPGHPGAGKDLSAGAGGEGRTAPHRGLCVLLRHQHRRGHPMCPRWRSTPGPSRTWCMWKTTSYLLQDTQDRMREIKELNLNRIVVAACTPGPMSPCSRTPCGRPASTLSVGDGQHPQPDSWVHQQDPEPPPKRPRIRCAWRWPRPARDYPLEAGCRCRWCRRALVIGGGWPA
jgi:hypothetical protein